ncbi:hypothetical protein GIB67_001629 [Kingdonia uniflora]|uniref:Uncharacterized protein n=1 Tax=Kingdonia uniflora TaxID=39325 RepID=A0A7J7L0Q3_9MAGN|nr:hypothetical protein GIB67_001629 [Kingdonia uniflora]
MFSNAIFIVILLCIPVFALQVFFIFYLSKESLPEAFGRSFMIIKGDGGINGDGEMVFCAYPLSSTIIFGTFATIYVLFFMLACWKVVALVINKSLRVRINALLFAVIIVLPLQVLFLALSLMWRPDGTIFKGHALLVFLMVLSCAVVGECILIIRPIADALAVGGESCQWEGEDQLPVVLGDKHGLKV